MYYFFQNLKKCIFVFIPSFHNRAMAAIMLLIGADDEKGAQCFKVDPAGHYLPYKAVATGKSEAEAMNYLEKKVAELGGLDEKATIEMVSILDGYVFVCMRACMCMYLCIFVCMYVCMYASCLVYLPITFLFYTYIYVCIYIHTFCINVSRQ